MPVPAAVRLGTGRVPIDGKTTIALDGVRGRSAARRRHAGARASARPHRSRAVARILLERRRRHARRHVQGAGPLAAGARRRRVVHARRESPGRAVRQHRGRRAPRARDVSPAPHRRPRRLLHSRGQHPGSPALSVARPAHRRRPPLRAGRGHQARAGRDGGRQAQRAPLAPERGPGLPRRKPQVPEAPRARIGRPVLHAGSAARRRRVRADARHSRRARVRHARPRHELGRRLSGAGERARARTRSRASSASSMPSSIPRAPDTYKFIDNFIGEIAKIFPDAYWHVGGDENNGKQWKANPKIQEFMQKRGIKDTRGAADVLQPAARRHPAQARQADDGVGRDSRAGSAEGSRDPVVARHSARSSTRRSRATTACCPPATTST